MKTKTESIAFTQNISIIKKRWISLVSLKKKSFKYFVYCCEIIFIDVPNPTRNPFYNCCK